MYRQPFARQSGPFPSQCASEYARTVRPLSAQFRPYAWALSTAEIARLAGFPAGDVLGFEGNPPPDAPATARPDTVAAALARIQSYRHGGFPELLQAIADYNGVEPENVVLGAGADDLLMLCARAYAGPGDEVDVRDEPVYAVMRGAVHLAGATVS